MSDAAATTYRVHRFPLLDVTVELEVPADQVGLLSVYPDRPDGLPCPDVRIEVHAADQRWDVIGESTTACDRFALPSTLLSAVNVAVLARTRRLAVHAGVVSVDGRSIAFPGGSGAGKSTITAACLRRGFEYVSDEALCLDLATALVHPFLRPLALDDNSWRLLGESTEGGGSALAASERVVSAFQLGARSVLAAQPLGHVVLLAREPGRLQLAPVRRGDALAALLRHSFNHYLMPEAAVDVVHRAVSAAQTWRLSYSDPLDAAALLRERLTANV